MSVQRGSNFEPQKQILIFLIKVYASWLMASNKCRTRDASLQGRHADYWRIRVHQKSN